MTRPASSTRNTRKTPEAPEAPSTDVTLSPEAEAALAAETLQANALAMAEAKGISVKEATQYLQAEAWLASGGGSKERLSEILRLSASAGTADKAKALFEAQQVSAASAITWRHQDMSKTVLACRAAYLAFCTNVIGVGRKAADKPVMTYDKYGEAYGVGKRQVTTWLVTGKAEAVLGVSHEAAEPDLRMLWHRLAMGNEAGSQEFRNVIDEAAGNIVSTPAKAEEYRQAAIQTLCEKFGIREAPAAIAAAEAESAAITDFSRPPEMPQAEAPAAPEAPAPEAEAPASPEAEAPAPEAPKAPEAAPATPEAPAPVVAPATSYTAPQVVKWLRQAHEVLVLLALTPESPGWEDVEDAVTVLSEWLGSTILAAEDIRHSA